jgi:hypothetical protein
MHAVVNHMKLSRPLDNDIIERMLGLIDVRGA